MRRESALVRRPQRCYPQITLFVLAGSTVQQIDQVLIPVEKVAPGMFPSERAVKVRGADNRELTLFVDERLITKHGATDYLRVTRIETDPGTGVSICLFPVPAVEGTRWIRIRNNALLEAAA